MLKRMVCMLIFSAFIFSTIAVPYEESNDISPEKAYQMSDVVFLDVRAPMEYKESHIKMQSSFPFPICIATHAFIRNLIDTRIKK